MILAILIIVITMFVACTAGDDLSSSSKEYKCQSCYKTFTNRTDTRSIRLSGMCETCHDNYEYNKALKEELKKRNERK